MMRRRKPVPPVRLPAGARSQVIDDVVLPAGYDPPSALLLPGGCGQAEPLRPVTPPKDPPADAGPRPAGPWDRRLPTPAELEAEHLARDLGARAQLAETLRPFDRPKRRELLTWAIRELVDASTAPTPKESTT